MFGKLLDSALKAPGDIAKAATETAVRLPGVPLDVAERAIDGAERGLDKLTDPGRKRP